MAAEPTPSPTPAPSGTYPSPGPAAPAATGNTVSAGSGLTLTSPVAPAPGENPLDGVYAAAAEGTASPGAFAYAIQQALDGIQNQEASALEAAGLGDAYAFGGVNLPVIVPMRGPQGIMNVPAQMIAQQLLAATPRDRMRFQANLVASGYLRDEDIQVPGHLDYATRRAMSFWLIESSQLRLDPTQLLRSRAAQLTGKGKDPYKGGTQTLEEYQAEQLGETYQRIWNEPPPPGVIDQAVSAGLNTQQFAHQLRSDPAYVASNAYRARSESLMSSVNAALSGAPPTRTAPARMGLDGVMQGVFEALYGAQPQTYSGGSLLPGGLLEQMAADFQAKGATLLKPGESYDERTNFFIRLDRWARQSFGQGGSMLEWLKTHNAKYAVIPSAERWNEMKLAASRTVYPEYVNGQEAGGGLDLSAVPYYLTGGYERQLPAADRAEAERSLTLGA